MSHAGVFIRVVAWMTITWTIIIINSIGGAR
jgi:hypothetical protein